MAEQGRILGELSALLDAGTLRTTLTEAVSPINGTNLRAAHARLESGRTIGKIAPFRVVDIGYRVERATNVVRLA